MRVEDVPAVMAIERVAFPVPWRASAYEYEVAHNRLARYHILTLTPDGAAEQLIGYTGYWMLADEAHISTIAVGPAWRGRGLGELLLVHLLLHTYEDAASLVTLEVRRSNAVAQALYLKYRFEFVGERRRYYADKEDALLMTAQPLDAAYQAFLIAQQGALFRRLDARPASETEIRQR
jgi:ribosomal-protein-alanine N-acetyltransferase